MYLDSFFTSGDFCRLLITFANSSDPDQGQQNVVPDLDPNCLSIPTVFLKEFFNSKKVSRQQQKHEN